MTDFRLLRKIVEMEECVVPALFKPVQFGILKKLSAGKGLDENEKRYLRGKMKAKLAILEQLEGVEAADGKSAFLNSLSSYYITGMDALKHNGFGWYFEPKLIEVINNRLEGRVSVGAKSLKFIRVKSLQKRKWEIDNKTGLKYATNEQILRDVLLTKNDYTRKVWVQMLSRYRGMFVKEYRKFKSLLSPGAGIDYKKFGV